MPESDISHITRDFFLIRKLTFEDIPEFVFEQIGKKNPATFSYFLFLVLLLAAVVVYPVVIYNESYPAGIWIRYSLFGFVLYPLLTIPVHEFIHGFMYMLAGAPRIRAGVELKFFFFYVVADRYPVGVKWFRRIAFAPSVIITIIILIIFFITGAHPLFRWSLLVTAFVHFTMCIGDFAMAGFLYEINHPGMITFDDLGEKTAYFYIPQPKYRDNNKGM